MDKEKIPSFACGPELIARNWTPESFYLGRALPEFSGGHSFDVGINDDRAVFIMAGARSGKGSGLLINNLLSWPGGTFCIDPKGELASITALRRGRGERAKGSGTTVRHFLGQFVAALDPFGEVKGPARLCRERYNPLDDIHPGSASFVSDINAVAGAIVVPEKGANSYFSDMARILLSGAFEAGLTLGRASDLPAIAAMVRGSWAEFQSLLEDCGGPLSRAALGAVEKFKDSREGNAVYTTLSRNLSWLDEPRMSRYLQGSGFSLIKAIQGDSSVYAVLPVEEMQQHKRWLRLMLAMAIRSKLRQGVFDKTRRHTLFVVDEMYQLGPMQEIEGGIAYLPGFGVKLVCVVQNIGQLKELYEKNWQTFLGNAGAVVAFGLVDDESAKYISDRIGDHYIERRSRSRGTSTSKPEWTGDTGIFGGLPEKGRDHEARAGTNIQEGESWNEQKEKVLRPEEVTFETAREKQRLIALMADGKPLFLERVDYFKDNSMYGPEWFENDKNILRIENKLNKNRR